MTNDVFVFDNKEFNSLTSFALYLKDNFRKALTFLTDDTLYSLLKNEIPEIYEKAIDLSKDFEHKENILTLIIYLLDSSLGIITPRYQFTNSGDIANEMKLSYPSINPDIKILFSDKILAHIFWTEYQKTSDSRYKRNYTFMLHVYENKQYEFTYFYYLFLHLYKNEVVRFTLDGLKMKSLREITIHVSNNLDRALEIMDEVVHNPYIMALMAIESGIEQVAMVLGSKNKLEILRLLSSYEHVDFTVLIRRKMSYWLLLNYQHYEYQTEEAKVLFSDYERLRKRNSLSTLSDYIVIYEEVNGLYERFLNLFNNNKYLSYKAGIDGKDDFYITYRHNDEYVCKQFLLDNQIYDYFIHTDVHCDSIEREMIVDALDREKSVLNEFHDEVVSITRNLNFNKSDLRGKKFASTMYILFVIFSVFAGFMLGAKKDNEINQMVVNGLFASAFIGFLLLFIGHYKYENRLKKMDLIESCKKKTLKSIDKIIEEKELVLNPNNEKFEVVSLDYRDAYAKNRKRDLEKIKKYAKSKTTVSLFWIILGTTLAILPIFEFGLCATMMAFDLKMVKLMVDNIDLSLFTLGIAALHFLLTIIFRKRNFIYYLIYIYIILIVGMSVLFF